MPGFVSKTLRSRRLHRDHDVFREPGYDRSRPAGSQRLSVLLCLLATTLWTAAAYGGSDLVVCDSLEFAGGQLTVIYRPDAIQRTEAFNQELKLLVHFHGAPAVCADNLQRAASDVVLAVVNFNGLSSAYRRPFQADAELFNRLLDEVAAELRRRGGIKRPISWSQIYLSCFSAGYGAVREILKSPQSFRRIDGLLAADSIYASLQAGVDARIADQEQMSGFLEFAKLASAGRRTFVITHSQVATPYASTKETADYLLANLSLERSQLQADESLGLQLTSRAERGRFRVLEYAGDSGEAHLEHLRQIHRWWSILLSPGDK